MSDIESNKAVVRKFFEYIGRGDVDALMDLYSESFTAWIAGSLPFSGVQPRAAIPDKVRGVRSIFPHGLTYTVRSMTAEQDRVSVEAELYGVHVSGKIYHNHLHWLFFVREGKIQAFHEYFDTMHANDVLCSTPAPGFNTSANAQ
ncbi:MAG: nuclear transport factor 2 family protein [Deltaproteobacteria bacterium]|nr:nuclear transport factor 2 family protein [Deltaproteobacteria bacterium]